MSYYCKWDSVVPELSPKVDSSVEKMLEICEEEGYESYIKYLKENDAVFSEARVYEAYCGGFVCQWVDYAEDYTETAREMAELLSEAIKKGKKVPKIAIDALLEDEKDNGA